MPVCCGLRGAGHPVRDIGKRMFPFACAFSIMQAYAPAANGRSAQPRRSGCLKMNMRHIASRNMPRRPIFGGRGREKHQSANGTPHIRSTTRPAAGHAATRRPVTRNGASFFTLLPLLPNLGTTYPESLPSAGHTPQTPAKPALYHNATSTRRSSRTDARRPRGRLRDFGRLLWERPSAPIAITTSQPKLGTAPRAGLP